MDKIKKYESAIIDLLKSYRHPSKVSETNIVTDTHHHHYQVVRVGWPDENTYLMRVLIYLQIKPDGKVWLLENRTENDIAQALVERGVEKSDIVLGFHPEYVRQYTGYAVA